MRILVTIAHYFSAEANSQQGSTSALGRSAGLLQIGLMDYGFSNLQMPVIPTL